jgi:hypothetical protein
VDDDDWYDASYDDHEWRDIMYCPSCDLFIDEEYTYAPRPLPTSPFVTYCLECGGITHEIRCLPDFYGEWHPQDAYADDAGYWPL